MVSHIDISLKFYLPTGVLRDAGFRYGWGIGESSLCKGQELFVFLWCSSTGRVSSFLYLHDIRTARTDSGCASAVLLPNFYVTDARCLVFHQTAGAHKVTEKETSVLLSEGLQLFTALGASLIQKPSSPK